MTTEKEIQEMRIEAILNAYLQCAAWADFPEEENRVYDGQPFSEKACINSRNDIESFLSQANDLLDEWDWEQIGHDLWLTRNGHGSGFWDRGLEHGDELTEIAQRFGSVYLWVDEDTNEIEIEEC